MSDMKQNIYSEISLDDLFKDPPAEYRGVPFWAWNGDLKEDVLLEQIEYFKKMGFGGAHMHIRTGMEQKYLGDEHMAFVKTCCEKFKSEDMLPWLYDEDRWPSGTAGGYVTKDIENRCKSLRFSMQRLPEDRFRKLLAAYSVRLSKDGGLESYSRISIDSAEATDRWFAYLETESRPVLWYGNQTYVDTMSADAIKAFADCSYEAYYKTVGEDFGKSIPAIFTDEPQYRPMEAFKSSFDKNDIYYPWTTSLVSFFKDQYGFDILDRLPEIFWELKDGEISVARYYLHDCISEMFASAYADTIGNWCYEHNIMLTGHLREEDSLQGQSEYIGEAMRSYRSFELPGVDILAHAFEYTTLKQCQSAVHQYGREGMLSELCGVTNWDFDFRGHKNQGDWQAALGVTVRVPHLSYYTMQGEAKRDYPASISYQSPWYEKYGCIETHFARVNTALRRGNPVVKVGIIHPIETFWLHMGPDDKTEKARKDLENKFQSITKWLLFSAIDFDFISESLLPSLCEKGENPLTVREMSYDVIVVPECETLRESTLSRLEGFRKNGGEIIFMGDPPSLCDAVPSERGKDLYKICAQIPFTRKALEAVLEKYRVLSISTLDGNNTDKYIYQMREESDGVRWLFIANGKNCLNDNTLKPEQIKLTLKGNYTPTLYNTLTGETEKIPYVNYGEETIIVRKVYQHDSILLRLVPSKGVNSLFLPDKSLSSLAVSVKSENAFELSEDNVLVLDMPEYRLNGGEWNSRDEMLRVDNACRQMLGWKSLTGRDMQPYAQPKETITNFVTLRFEILSEINVDSPRLALERLDMAEISLNGKSAEKKSVGYYIDRCLNIVELPPLGVGKNILEVKCPIGSRVSLENMFLLGKFGVKASGSEARIVALPEALAFGDIRGQGLDFYGANVSYNCEIDVPESGDLSVTVPEYIGSLVGVRLDGEENGNIIFAPYELTIPDVTAGKHTLSLCIYGNRFNTLGQLHCHHDKMFKAHDTDELPWFGPASFRTTGEMWSYDYKTKPVGIIATPICKIIKQK